MRRPEHPIRPPTAAAVVFGLAVAACLAMARPADAQGAHLLLQEGIYLEVGRCDPRAAADVYRRVIELKSRTAEQAATAHVRLGVCLETLGEQARAREQFRVVLESYASESAAAALARRFLGRPSSADPARWMPPEMLFYVELVNPAEHVDRVAECVRGTPFSSRADDLEAPRSLPAPGSAELAVEGRLPSPVERAAGFLNKFYLREIKKIGGLAFGIPEHGEADGQFIGVFFPGSSDVLPGIAANLLASAPRLGAAGRLQLFRVGGEAQEGAASVDTPVYVAFGDDALLWGRPRRLVEEAVARFESGGPSLATTGAFEKAQALRSGSLLFAYVGSSWFEALSASAKPEERPRLEGLRRAMALDRLRPLAATITPSTLDDSLSVTLHVALRESDAPPLWPFFHTAEIDGAILRCVPEDALGFSALRLAGAPERWAALRRALEELAGCLAAADRDATLAWVDRLGARLEAEPGKDLIALLDTVVFGAVPFPPSRPHEAFFVALELLDSERGERALRSVIADLLGALFASPASRTFGSENIALAAGDLQGLVAHFVEPAPGLRLYYARSGKVFLIAFSRSTLLAAAAASRAAGKDLRAWRMPGAAKVLSLRPARIVQAVDPSQGELASPAVRSSDAARFLAAHVPDLLLFSREGNDSLAVELRVPTLTATIRNILNAYARELEATASGSTSPR